MEGRAKEGRKDGGKNERKKGWAKTTHPLVYSFIDPSFPLYPFIVYSLTTFHPRRLSIFVSYIVSFFLLFFLLKAGRKKGRTKERKEENDPPAGIFFLMGWLGLPEYDGFSPPRFFCFNAGLFPTGTGAPPN